MITLATKQVAPDWQGFLIVMGVLAFTVLYSHFMLRDDYYRPTVQQLLDEADSATVVDCADRLTGNTLTLEPEIDFDLEVCTVCSGEGALQLHFAADDEWESRECDFCSGTGLVGGVA